mgnify:CR=1 FL=1|jgi:glutamate formiminotransferase
MEAITELMSLIDTHCEKIPEGDYLTMCNRLRSIFTFVNGSVDTETDTDDEYSPTDVTVNIIPFTPTPTTRVYGVGVDVDARRSILNREYIEITGQLKILNRTLKQYRILRNITSRVKREAVKSFCSNRLLRLGDYTFSELIGTYPQYNISDERRFYLEYITYHNEIVRETTSQIIDEIETLEIARSECLERYEECQ